MSTNAMASQRSVTGSLGIQGRIVGALLMREILTRYGRHNIGFMWLFVEPMMFTLGVLALWTILSLHHVALPIVPFTLSGYASVLLWRNTINRCGNAVEPNRSLLHHRNVRVIDLFVSRIILELAGASMSFLFLSISLGVFGLIPAPDDLLKIIAGWILLGWFAATFALIIGALSALNESVERVWHVLSYLFLPLSGAFFMVSWLPPKLQAIVLWVPTVSCVELIRSGMFGPSIHAKFDIPYVIAVNIVLAMPALLLVIYVANTIEGE